MAEQQLNHVSRPTQTPTLGEITPVDVTARLPKGGSATSLPRDILVLDTGQPNPPVPSMRNPQSQSDVDALYRATIAAGIVDHHGIDATVPTFPAGAERLSTTGMIARFPIDVLNVIGLDGKREVTAHLDSDLDSIASSYLARALVQYKTIAALPSCTDRLGEYVNKVDFGRARMPLCDDGSPDVVAYAKSLAGVFSALKSSIEGERQKALSPLFANREMNPTDKKRQIDEIASTFQHELTARSFEIFNACEAAYVASGGELTFENISSVFEQLAPETRRHITVGASTLLSSMEVFRKEFDVALRAPVTVTTKAGDQRSVELIVIPQTAIHPLQAANLVDYFAAPDAITAVYAGPNRTKGGDQYDIRIRPETGDLFDLKSLELPLNQAEAAGRQVELAEIREKEAAGTADAGQLALLTSWTTLRKGFEHVGHGDPTVCVAGGTLIAASNTSRLSADDFVRVLEQHFGVSLRERK